MNLRSILGAIGIAAMVASSAVAASAQPAQPVYQNVPPPSGYRQQSATNVAMMAQRIGKMIEHLQADARDYSGHRVAAIRALQNAQGELSAAAQFAADHGYQIAVPPPVRRNPGGGMRRPPPTSDTQMERAQGALRHMIARLQGDSHDFGGHRVAAVNLMQQADVELNAAIQFAAAHGT